MEANTDKYAKAKIEDPNFRFPKAMTKPKTQPAAGELCYKEIFEDDIWRAKHLAEELAAGAKLDRKAYRIRNTELFKAIEDMDRIHKVSKATIGVLTEAEADQHFQSFLDLLGTVEQVKTAEELILDKILETYVGPVFPVILMPPKVHKHDIRIHVDKVARLVGENGNNVLAIEVVSGAWLRVNNQPPADGPNYERIVNIYGPRAHVIRAVSLIHSQVYKPGECLEAEDELEMLFEELTFSEVMEGMESRIPQMDDLVRAAFASGSGSSSGQTEGEKLQQDVEVAEDKDESKGKKKQQDVKEAVSGEPKGSVEELD
ncbi:putative K domain-containing protein [Helianthus annuus]|nr:putative K domain-containing protein [Helianthus annuus]